MNSLRDLNCFCAGSRKGSDRDQLTKCKVIFVLGGPGSGKGTQCEKMVKQFGFNHLSSGDLLRAEVNSGSERGNELKKKMEAGELVSSIMKDAMKKLPMDKAFLIDGYPREVGQGINFEKEIAKCCMVIYFDLSEEVMKQRLLERGKTSGRADDNETTIMKRFTTFKEFTKPVIEHYDKEKKTFKIDASGNIDTIFENVCNGLKQFKVIN